MTQAGDGRAVARRSLHPRQWTPAIATLTVGFALGQCAGPIMAGVLSDGAAGVRAGLTLSAAILAAGSLLALAQPERRPGTQTRPAQPEQPHSPAGRPGPAGGPR